MSRSPSSAGAAPSRVPIPTPPRGYWARLKAGQHAPRPGLPEAPAGMDRPVTVFVPVLLPLPVPACPAPPPAHRSQPTPVAVLTPNEESRLHPIARRVLHCLRHHKLSGRGLVRIRESGLPRISASPVLADRVAATVDALLVAAAARGYAPEAGATGQMHLYCRGQRALFRLEEEIECLDPAAYATGRRAGCGSFSPSRTPRPRARDPGRNPRRPRLKPSSSRCPPHSPASWPVSIPAERRPLQPHRPDPPP